MLDGLKFLNEFQTPKMGAKAKHAHLATALLAAIDAGHWQPGAKLPTEQELTRHTPYSLGTVQRAMRSLVESGVVVRRQGAGSYVAASDSLIDDPWHLRFYADDGVSFLTVTPKVTFRDRYAGNGYWNEFLKLDADDEVVQVDRRIDVGGEFTVMSRFFAAADPYAGLLYRPLSELDGANFNKSLRSELGIVIAEVSQDARVAAFPQEVCGVLSLADQSAGLFLQMVGRNADGDAIYYQELYIPATERRLHMSVISGGETR